MTENPIRKSSIAGSWYPDNPGVLQETISGFFQQVSDKSVEGTVIGLVSPHAGYAYSGQIAAHAYKMLREQSFDAVIVIGPSHRIAFQGVSAYDRGGYETPLGTVPVDSELAGRIKAASPLISITPYAHLQEHSIEIQLPFLQYVLGNFSFVPLLMGTQDRRTCEDLAAAIIKAVAGQRVLVVGSSDLSHFHDYDQALKLDMRALAHLEKMDADGFLNGLEAREFEACGGGPAAVTMMVAAGLGANRSKLLRYNNSGDVTGDRQSVVGYAAALFYDDRSSEKTPAGETTSGAETGLKDAEKRLLVNIVRATIEAKLSGRDASKLPELPAILKQERGAFVTLHKHGRLRGCIGYIEAHRPLYQAVEEMAVAAAFRDTRFPALTREEWPHITFEISVLSPLKEIKDIEEIEVGRHGIYIVHGRHCGLLLPQVATECHWDRLTFLQQTCCKAGLPLQAWKDEEAKIFIFSADIFGSEEKHNHNSEI